MQAVGGYAEDGQGGAQGGQEHPGPGPRAGQELDQAQPPHRE